jgi:multiple sugar transport system permease protein
MTATPAQRSAAAGRAAARRRPAGIVATLGLALGFVVIVVVNLIPLVWGILTSFKGQTDLFRFPPTIIDFQPTIENYEQVMAGGFGANMQISVIYCLVSVVATLILALPAAYAFDRFEFPFRRALFMLVVASIPLSMGAAALLIPNYVYFVRLGLTNQWFTLPLIYTSHQLPMAIWIIKGTMESIPREIDEAAIVDGASTFGALRMVILPLTGPAMGAAALLTFVGAWNEFVAGSVMVNSPALKPIQPAIYSFIGYFGREWGPLTASATIAVLPIVVVFLLFGRLVVSGLTKGSVKG